MAVHLFAADQKCAIAIGKPVFVTLLESIYGLEIDLGFDLVVLILNG